MTVSALMLLFSDSELPVNHITSLRDYDFMDTKLDAVRICVALYQLGDFLRVASLCNEAQTELHHIMKLKAQHIQDSLASFGLGPPECLAVQFTKYAKIAYSIPESKDPSIKGSIRHPFIHFFTLTRFNVIGEEDFLQELQAIPGLLADILWQLARVDRGEDSHCDAEQLYEKHRRTINQECQICKKDPLFDDINQEVNLWMVGKKCYKCWSDERGDITALGGVGEDDLKKLPKFLYVPDNL